MSLVPFNRQDRVAFRPLTHMLDNFWGEAWRPMQHLLNRTFKMDVREELLHYTVEAEMPGVKKEDIRISFQDGKLTIALTHREQVFNEKGNYVHRERTYTDSQRTVYLDGATGDGITAALKEGELRITVPKQEEAAKSIRIEVQP